jgi:hypothetical protein
VDKLDKKKLVYNIEIVGANNFSVGKGKINPSESLAEDSEDSLFRIKKFTVPSPDNPKSDKCNAALSHNNLR